MLVEGHPSILHARFVLLFVSAVVCFFSLHVAYYAESGS